MKRFGKNRKTINELYKVSASYRLVESYNDEWPETNGYIIKENNSRQSYYTHRPYIEEWINMINALSINNIGIVVNNKNYPDILAILVYELTKHNISFTLIFEGRDEISDSIDFNN